MSLEGYGCMKQNVGSQTRDQRSERSKCPFIADIEHIEHKCRLFIN